MNTHFTLAAGLLAGSFLLPLASAQAHGTVQWSVTVGTPSYPAYVYTPPGVVVYPQSQYIYGAPPSAFAPPPTVYYVQPQPVYRVNPPPVIYYERAPLREYRRHEWDGRHHHGWDERNRWGDRR
jgi:hypothetical protein